MVQDTTRTRLLLSLACVIDCNFVTRHAYFSFLAYFKIQVPACFLVDSDAFFSFFSISSSFLKRPTTSLDQLLVLAILRLDSTFQPVDEKCPNIS